MSTKPKLLGMTSSLRNARWGKNDLIGSLKTILSKEDLFAFLSRESELHVANFLDAGRREGKSFLEIYRNLNKNSGNKGLCNSEVALSAALWAAYHTFDVDIEHISLSEYFPATGKARKLGELQEKIIASDGLLLSGPVYFGDRSSIAQSLLDYIFGNSHLRECLQGKIYAGISVGAKRNGGQETTLIYQMLDFLRLNMLAVGNDSDTTAQYGGTCHAGDVGSMHKDIYGLETSMGTGRRISSVLKQLSSNRELQGTLKVLFLILQDQNGEALSRVKNIVETFKDDLDASIINICEKHIRRCLACDFCPVSIGPDDIYRCVINSGDDDLKKLHPLLLNHDAIIPVSLSVRNNSNIISNYQNFIERTRYLRRGDYVFSNLLVAPLIFEEVGFGENYSIRMITSFIRHHTIISNPMTGYIQTGKLINEEQLNDHFTRFVKSGKIIAASRIAATANNNGLKYNPIGYVLSVDKDKEDERLEKRNAGIRDRYTRMMREFETRLK
jgi:multimeric flavodoxin WrbA